MKNNQIHYTKEKDIIEKKLEAYPEIFADILNVLLFSGRQVVKAGDLKEADIKVLYEGEDGYREQTGE